MLEPGGRPDFVQEALRTESSCKFGVEHLEGHRPLVLEITGEINSGHAARTEFPLEAIAV